MITPPLPLRSQRDSGPARVPAAKWSAAARRHAPYARPTQHTTPRARSFTDCLLDIWKQLSKPLFGESPGRPSGDAFSVPWGVVDRETSELRAEQLQAQQEAATATKHPAADSTEDVEAALATKAVSGNNDEDDDDDDDMDCTSDNEDDEDEYMDCTTDYATNDEDEEEILQSEIEPICEQEEIAALPAGGSTGSSAALATQRAAGPLVSRIAKFFEQRGASSHADNNLTDMSVKETSGSDGNEAVRQKPAQPSYEDAFVEKAVAV
ncbi:hypothetical protein IWQ56_002423 [Coemansia nantahalensis]|nr:hypothetical protein IWQ56_002423 [Coemansia nantahalensis]